MQENIDNCEEFADNLIKKAEKYKCVDVFYDKRNKITTTKVCINGNKLSKLFNKRKGFYYSVKCGCFNYYDKTNYKSISKKVFKTLKELSMTLDIKKPFSVLVVGLGNSKVLCDSLGVKVCDKIIIPNTYDSDFLNKVFNKVYCFCPSVFAKTGIITADIILSVVKKVNPSMVILIDTLTCKNRNLLGCCFQMNNVGLKPGGFFTKSKWVDKKLLNVPVVSIGVPLVTNLSDILGENESYEYYTTKNIGEVVDAWAWVLALGINMFLQPKLNIDDILFYMS